MIFCEGTSNSWIAISTGNVLDYCKLYSKILQESEDPFCCPHCCLITQDKQLQELKTMVEDLLNEVVLLRATISAN